MSQIHCPAVQNSKAQQLTVNHWGKNAFEVLIGGTNPELADWAVASGQASNEGILGGRVDGS